MRKLLFLLMAAIMMLGMVSTETSAYFHDSEESLSNSLTAWVQVSELKYFVADSSEIAVFKYWESGNFADLFYLHGNNEEPAGVAAAGSSILVLDAEDKKVYLYSDSGEYQAVSRVLRDARGKNLNKPCGIAVDIDDLWLVEHNGSIYRYSLTEAFNDEIFPLNASQEIELSIFNNKASGLAFGSGYLAVLDENDKRFYLYSTNGVGGIPSKLLLDTSGEELSAPSGAMYDGESLWVVDRDNARIFQYSVSQLFTVFGSVQAVSEFELDILNTEAEGL